VGPWGVPGGVRRPLPGGGPGPPGQRGRVLDRPPPVTNAAFARFVHNTGYVTVAEQAPDPADSPGARPELLVPASMVFRTRGRPVDLGGPTRGGPMCRGPTGATSGASQLDQQAARPSGGPGRRGRRGRRGRLGGQAAAQRGPVGAGGPGWAGGGHLRLGEGGPLPGGGGWPPPGRGSSRSRTWSWTAMGDGAGGSVPGQRLRPARHDRQRGGVDRRLVPGPRRAGPRLLHGRQPPRGGERERSRDPRDRAAIPGG